MMRYKVKQSGTALLVAMVALVAMMTAGMALIRTVDSANLAASNFQFQRTVDQNVDMALNEAMLAYLQSSTVAPAFNMTDRNQNAGATLGYMAAVTATSDSSQGLPSQLLNAPVPTWGANGPTATGWPGEQIDTVSQQLRRYYVERLCNSTGIASLDKCRMYTLTYEANAIKGSGKVDEDNLPYVRITVRVDGPKGAVSYAQMFLKGE